MKRLPWLWLGVCLFSSMSWAESTTPAKWQTLSQGTATWLFMDIYQAKLKSKMSLKANFLSNEQPLQLELCYFKSISPDILIKGANEVLPDNLSVDLQAAVNGLHASYQAVEPNDCYRLSYENGITQLQLNEQTVFTTKTAGFKAVYFGIWLGENPLSASLKKELLNLKTPRENT
ncbi:chalcone isomerase family protein [Thiosulfativibrio zosterae]|uniref:Chalcone isomerase domain-containing protein n=1 Tax=Thiosulfativibrio zosterae TaxID=2675053 RepID=A0A6F8PM39_9GAMM|nr:chalcone isomerase family protein [Thiosulfativibrio zosterae]BBP43173.1 hypothetical protein THMIRHAT_09190 [Thiosulfativibrio zosterae]